MRTLCAALVALLLPAAALAQVPEKLGYQGRLLKADGTPESGLVSLTFSIYSADSGGQPLWTETQMVGMTSGFYSTFLGQVAPFPAGLFDGSDRYLALTVDGKELSPRQRVGSVAYAMRATTAVNVSGGEVDASRILVNGKPVIDATGKVASGAVDTSVVQSRISGTCTTGTAIAEIKSDGTVTCIPVASSPLTSLTALSPLSSTGGTTPQLSIAAASATSDGYLSASDYILFAAKVGSVGAGTGLSLGGTPGAPILSADLTKLQGRVTTVCPAGSFITEIKEDGTAICSNVPAGPAGVTSVTASAPLSSSGGATPNLVMSQSSATSAGYLSALDWATFNGKVGSVGAGSGVLIGGTATAPSVGLDFTKVQTRVASGCAAGSYIRSINADGTVVCDPDADSGGTVTSVLASSPLSASGGATPTISLTAASSTSAGYLTQTDYALFLGKQARVTGTCAAGKYITAINADGSVVCGTDANSGGTVTSVTASGPLASSGGATPNLTITAASSTSAGYLTQADYAAFVAKVGSVTGGTGITIAGTATAPKISVDTTAIQARVSGTCTAGSFVTGVNADGTVVCASDSNSGTVTAVNATSPLSSTGGTTPTLSMTAASSTAAGYLTQTDYALFTAKQTRVSGTCAAGKYVTAINADGTVVCGTDANSGGTVTSVTASGPLASSGGATPNLTITAASSTSAGYLTQADYAAFTAKQARVSGTCSAGNFVTGVNADGTVVCAADANSGGTVTSVTATGPITSSGGATPNLAIAASSDTVPGYLTAADHAAFNAKQARVSGTCAAGRYVTAINADGTVVCGTDANSGGTVTGVSGGTGITIGGTATAPSVSVNTTAIQARVSGTCTAGNFVTGVNADGTVVCAADANSGGTVTSVTATGPITSTGGTTPNLAIAASSDTVAGYLTAADHAAFNAKQARVTGTCAAGRYVTAINSDGTVVCGTDANSGGTVTSVTATGPLASSGGATPNLTMTAASSTSAGYLTQADYTTFLAKVSSVSAGTGVSIGGTATAPTVSVVYGTSAGTAAQGNDARLSDARAPTAGSGNYIQNQSASAQSADFNITGNATVGSIKVGGSVDMGGNRVQNVATPTANTDAANKAYVDASIGGGSVIAAKPWVGRSAVGSTYATTFTQIINMAPLTAGNYISPTSLVLEGNNGGACTGSFVYTFRYADGTSLTSPTYTTGSSSYATLINTQVPTHSAYKGNVTNITVDAWNNCGASGYAANARLTISGFETGSAGLINAKPWVGRSAVGSTYATTFTQIINMAPLTAGNYITPTSLVLEGNNGGACTGSFVYTFKYADGTSLTSPTYTTGSSSYATLINTQVPTHSAYKGNVTSITVDAWNNCGASGYAANARLTISGFETN